METASYIIEKINKGFMGLAEKTKQFHILILSGAWFIWLLSAFVISFCWQESFFTYWSSLASILSFFVLLPILLLQLATEKKALQTTRDTFEKQLININNAITDHLKELRPISTTEESLQHLLDWMKPDSSKTLSLLYVSKLSVIPGFWIRGNSAIITNLTAGDYSNMGTRNISFIGPAPNTMAFKEIAQLAINIANDDEECKKLHEKTRIRFQFLKNMSIEDIQKEYQTSLGVLRKNGISIHELTDNTLGKLSVNFVLRRIPPERSAVNSPWEMMFFDDANILNGQSLASQAKQAFFDPAIYMSENAALGYMFRFMTRQATTLDLKVE